MEDTLKAFLRKMRPEKMLFESYRKELVMKIELASNIQNFQEIMDSKDSIEQEQQLGNTLNVELKLSHDLRGRPAFPPAFDSENVTLLALS